MTQDQPTQSHAFVDWLEEKRDKENSDARALFARLKRGLGKTLGEEPLADRVIYGWFDGENYDEGKAREFHLIATLFAMHPQAGGTGNIGDHFRELWGDAKEPPSNVERRFMRLLSADRADLPDVLRHAISLLEAKGVPVNWHQLLDDLKAWAYRSRVIQKEWAKRFWRGTIKGQTKEPEPPSTEKEGE